MNPNKHYFTYIEYIAARLYYSDVRLHLILDQADSGIYLEDSEWETGVKNPADDLNFHHLWASLEDSQKNLYRELARCDLSSNSEIKKR